VYYGAYKPWKMPLGGRIQPPERRKERFEIDFKKGAPVRFSKFQINAFEMPKLME
jgi:hypothetical protein